jgi:hypothetical protein
VVRWEVRDVLGVVVVVEAAAAAAATALSVGRGSMEPVLHTNKHVVRQCLTYCGVSSGRKRTTKSSTLAVDLQSRTIQRR